MFEPGFGNSILELWVRELDVRTPGSGTLCSNLGSGRRPSPVRGGAKHSSPVNVQVSGSEVGLLLVYYYYYYYDCC